jgi:DNA replication protein DnaC
VPGALVLLSHAGGGKTSAGAWAVTWHRRKALYTTASHVAANPLVHHSEARSVWSSLLAPDLLIIDEIGREPSDKGPSMVMALYLERDAHGRATILMGNRTTAEFLSRYIEGDGAIGSRFEQQRALGLDPVVPFAGRDLRMG